jgi:hypothetical protein
MPASIKTIIIHSCIWMTPNYFIKYPKHLLLLILLKALTIPSIPSYILPTAEKDTVT